MSKMRLIVGDKRLLKMIRQAADELLPEFSEALESNTVDAMAQAMADVPVGEVDTDGLPPLHTTGFVGTVSIDKASGRSNARFGFTHPKAAYVEVGVAWGLTAKQRGVAPPFFVHRATKKFRRKYNKDLVAILRRFLAKKLAPKGA